MRTTININDKLLQSAKLKAAQSNCTLTSVIEEALRLALEPGPAMPPTEKVRVPTSGEGGLQPGVDLDDMASLLDHMENRT